METFAPEFSRYWLADGELDESRRESLRDESHAEQQALLELAERVNAARSIV